MSNFNLEKKRWCEKKKKCRKTCDQVQSGKIVGSNIKLISCFGALVAMHHQQDLKTKFQGMTSAKKFQKSFKKVVSLFLDLRQKEQFHCLIFIFHIVSEQLQRHVSTNNVDGFQNSCNLLFLPTMLIYFLLFCFWFGFRCLMIIFHIVSEKSQWNVSSNNVDGFQKSCNGLFLQTILMESSLFCF